MVYALLLLLLYLNILLYVWLEIDTTHQPKLRKVLTAKPIQDPKGQENFPALNGLGLNGCLSSSCLFCPLTPVPNVYVFELVLAVLPLPRCRQISSTKPRLLSQIAPALNGNTLLKYITIGYPIPLACSALSQLHLYHYVILLVLRQYKPPRPCPLHITPLQLFNSHSTLLANIFPYLWYL